MTIGIRNNLVSSKASGQLQRTQQGLSRSAQRLASGSRIDRVGQDASGAAVSFNLSSRANSVRQAMRNANDGISLLATNEAAAQTFSDTLSRMRELAVQGASETLSAPQRAGLESEFANNADELRRLIFSTTFNGARIVSGVSRTVQVGADNDAAHQIDITGANLKSVHILVAGSSVGTAEIAQDAIDDIDTAFDSLNSARANLGSEMNRLESAMANAAAEAEALSGASSRIFDTDFARETARMTALQVRSQAGISALTQAKGMSSSVISLIG